MADILLVDDDRELCELLTDYLQREGFTVRIAHDGLDGLHTATRARPDLVVCDIMMPAMDGLELLRQLRQESSVPVLMLTAKRAEVDRIAGLELGADDYLPKPFSARELVARVRAILRRTCGEPTETDGPSDEITTIGDLTIDRARQRATRSGNQVELTATELDLLGWLLERAGETVDRRFLFQRVLGRDPSPDDRGVDMMVSRVRRKLGPHADGRLRILAVRSLGYVYVLP
ncbi:MAG: response regulator transcription factor [Phycisphaerae bacterium]|nr:response regulator transcription factor [Phycisphaerae bacterium]